MEGATFHAEPAKKPALMKPRGGNHTKTDGSLGFDKTLQRWVTRWCFQAFLEFSSLNLGEDEPILTSIFFF